MFYTQTYPSAQFADPQGHMSSLDKAARQVLRHAVDTCVL